MALCDLGSGAVGRIRICSAPLCDIVRAATFLSVISLDWTLDSVTGQLWCQGASLSAESHFLYGDSQRRREERVSVSVKKK